MTRLNVKDYQCPYCGLFHQLWMMLKTRWVECRNKQCPYYLQNKAFFTAPLKRFEVKEAAPERSKEMPE